ncbi:MAG: bifunctional diaminohydroxyphosphoribosylaminopyrimidine deaminase/5-amino-6-(5-phosphoribosylamino)uracil reductase RibD [Fimbriimonas sp.]
MTWTEADVRFMRRAIELSKNGFPAPNPHVGCVIVKGGEVIGEGWHEYAGAAHAEVAALKGIGANGAEAYVSLEPCNHQGRTGPCSVALIEAGVKRVVYACSDPNPKAVGGGERLRQAGIQVQSGLLEEEARQANEQFFFALEHKRPIIVLKAACSLDGRIALTNGESKWITGEAARHQAHRLRAELGAVLVGRKTVEQDDPELTARIEGVTNQPTRIVLDPSGKLKGREKVFNQAAPTVHITGAIDLQDLVASLFEQNITGLLVEGGAQTISGFLKANLHDRLELFLAPKILGTGPTWPEGFPLTSLKEAPTWQIIQTQQLGQDLWLTATPT